MNSVTDFFQVARVLADTLVTIVCISSTILHLLCIMLAIVLQYKQVYHAADIDGRLVNGKVSDPHMFVILRNWGVIGIGSMSALGLVQWFWLKDSPWAYLFPVTVVFTVIFIRLYWGDGMRYVSQRTERRDYALAATGTSPKAP